MSETQDNINTELIDDLDNFDDQISEAEKFAADLEQKIKEESPEMLNIETPTFTPPKSKKKKETKNDIMDKIMKLQATLDVDQRPLSHFKIKTKAECEEHLAWLTNQALNQVNGTDDKMKFQTEATAELDTEYTGPLPNKGKFSKDWGAKGLYQFNKIVCKVIELGSANFKEKLQTDLVGLCDDVDANKDELIEIMAEIYAEHGDSIGQYLTPLNRYALLMTTLGANRAVINRERVEQELEKKHMRS
jgi:hypothetical protein